MRAVLALGALCAALAVLLHRGSATPLPDPEPADAEVVVPASEHDVDDQILGLIQELEALQVLTPREKRAVNSLLGGGASGGSFLNELNKGPTYSQLLGQSGGGGGFNKLGIFSSLLGSSSGGAAGGGAGSGDAGQSAGAGSDSGSILGLITPLLGSSSGSSGGGGGGPASVLSNPLLELGLIPDLPGGDATEPTDVDVGAAKRSARQADEESTAAVDSSDISAGGGASAGASFSLGADGADIGASAGASIDDGGSASPGGGSGGSDSGSILGLVTPLLGSSSQGSSGDGSASGGGNPASAGGGLIGTLLSAAAQIKSFIFRKIVQLLTSSSGSPQAG